MSHLFFSERGKGQPVILIHGFPFRGEIWNDFAVKLSANFKVYTIDLPGFGESPSLKSPFSIDDVADVVVSWVKENNIIDPIIIGHSLGGYVTLAIADKDQNLPIAIGLFHSTAYADSEEKKQSRDKVIEFISKNGVVAFSSNFISTLFADPKHPAIENVKKIAVQATEEAVKGYTMAMRNRSDKTNLLRSFPKPILFIAGEKDGGISVDSIHKQAAICQQPETHILQGVAHMGMFENEKKSIEIINSFIGKNRVTK